MSNALKTLEEVIEGADKASKILKVFGPLAEDLYGYVFGDGPEPAVFEQLPELRAPAALERARHRARSTPPSA